MFHICPCKLTDWWWAIELQSSVMLVTPKHCSITYYYNAFKSWIWWYWCFERKKPSPVCCSTATSVGPSLILMWTWTILRHYLKAREDDPLLGTWEEDEASPHSSSLLEQSCRAPEWIEALWRPKEGRASGLTTWSWPQGARRLILTMTLLIRLCTKYSFDLSLTMELMSRSISTATVKESLCKGNICGI